MINAGSQSSKSAISDALKAWYTVDPIPFKNNKGRNIVIIGYRIYWPLSFQTQNMTGIRKNRDEKAFHGSWINASA
jgi:hypothetical protein